ncbi:hypothetical protein MHH60_12825 [Paenibacillus sp. FSL H7-0716]|uniref:hypothetical protein n=1 Tax=Paenibacillus TaxID=44249 RepID=UPI00117C84E1|nr:hypothetical protein [Paenibacillus odorifer]
MIHENNPADPHAGLFFNQSVFVSGYSVISIHSTIHHSPFTIHHSTIPHSPFPIPHSPFTIHPLCRSVVRTQVTLLS